MLLQVGQLKWHRAPRLLHPPTATLQGVPDSTEHLYALKLKFYTKVARVLCEFYRLHEI